MRDNCTSVPLSIYPLRAQNPWVAHFCEVHAHTLIDARDSEALDSVAISHIARETSLQP